MNFIQFLKECLDGGEGSTLPACTGEPEATDFSNPTERESVNNILSDLTDKEVRHPAVTYEQVRHILWGFGYLIPPASTYAETLDDTDGEEILALTTDAGACYLYFAFSQDDEGHVDTLAEIMTESELEELLDEDIE